jgi:hypothetical protein
MEALSSSGTSVLTRATRRNIPEDAILHNRISLQETLLYHFNDFTVAGMNKGGRDTEVGCGTMLQTERSWVRLPMRPLDSPIDLNLPAATRSRVRLGLWYERIPGIFLRVKGAGP